VLHVVLVATKADDADTAGALRFTATTVVAGATAGTAALKKKSTSKT